MRNRRYRERVGAELIVMKERDLRVRARLAADGSLFDGYHPEMEAVHRENARRLSEIMGQIGWPDETLVGEDGAEAAWLIAQHAIGEPDFQRRCLAAVRAAVEAGKAPAWQAACLDDRIRVFEGRPQLYGTQFDMTASGEPVPFPVDHPARVDERRRAIGLEPLAERMAGLERTPPMDPERWTRRQREYERWLKETGWRE